MNRTTVAAACAGGLLLTALTGAAPASARPGDLPTASGCPVPQLLSVADLIERSPGYLPVEELVDLDDDGSVCGVPLPRPAGERLCPPVDPFCQVPVVYLFRDNTLVRNR